jgi:hypothetical protein
MADESESISTVSEAPSTPAPATEAPAPSTPTAEPPAGQSGTSKESMLDAVLKVVPADNQKDVLASEEKAHPEAPADTPEDGTAEAQPEDDDDAEPPEDSGNPLLRKKIRKLLKDRHELRDTVQQLEELRPAAEIGQQMQEFARVNDLTGDDVAQVMQLAAMLRQGDYASFYSAVSPYVRTAQEYLGIALPKDLRDRVQAGHMSEQTAREFARTRMDEQRGRQEFTVAQQQIATQQLHSTQNNVARSVTAFEQRLAASDPDYKAKAASVRRTAQAMLLERGGTIQTVEDALSITRAAYEEVNATMRRQRPAPVPTSRTPNGNGTTSPVTAEPKSIMEAALQGLARARNGAGHP